AVVDLNNVESIGKAMQGIDKVFSLSPFVPQLAKIGKNIVKAAKTAGIKYMVRSSGLGADNPNAITLGQWHREAEKAVEDSGIPFTIVRPASFMQIYINFFSQTIKQQGAFYAAQGEGKVSLIDVRDVAEVMVKVLTSGGHEGKAYNITGPEALSNQEIAGILTDVAGRSIKYIDVPDNAAKKAMLDMGMPEELVNPLMELVAIYKAGYASAVLPTVEKLLGRKPCAFRRFAQDFRGSFV
ncbi:MAG: NmrA family NAD(P)-binding protein, partial [Deltaproteobacteria bacterium]|nr:NmrA family NAD(P)-binding protein [Deltaproteobacteria bacterium]